jgi:hypothetical protein
LIPFGRKEFVSNPSGVVFSLVEIVFGLREILFALKEIVSGRGETFSDLGEIVFGVRKFLSGRRQILSARRGIHPRPEKIVSAPKRDRIPPQKNCSQSRRYQMPLKNDGAASNPNRKRALTGPQERLPRLAFVFFILFSLPQRMSDRH